MSISVVIPAHNAEPYLAETIESVLVQTVRDWELVIVDDGSTDSTAAVAQAYAERDSRIRVVQQTNGGIAAARNRGFWESSPASEFVVFLDHDDVWEKDALATLMSALHVRAEAAAAHGLSRTIDAQGRDCEPGEREIWGRHRRGVVGKRIVAWPLDQPTTLAVLAVRNCIWTPGQALVRRSALEAAGPFDPSASPCDDWDMWLRLSQRGPILYLDRVVLNWRVHDQNVSRDERMLFRKQCFVRGKLITSSLSEEQRQTVLVANRFWSRHICSQRLRWARYQLTHRRPGQGLHLLGRACSAYIRCLRGLPAS